MSRTTSATSTAAAIATATPILLFVGADVAALSVTVAWHASGQGSSNGSTNGSQQEPSFEPMQPVRPFTVITIEQSPTGFALLRKRLASTGIAPQHTLVVLEATSTYWIRLATTLHAAGYQMSVINPKQAHDFAKALLQHGKTDPLDAKMLAELGAKLNPPPWTVLLQQFSQLGRKAC